MSSALDMTKTEEQMTDELSRLARLETKIDDLMIDTREVKAMVQKRDEVCMKHSEIIAAHEERLTNISCNLDQLSTRTWYIIAGVLASLLGFVLDFVKKG